ncbi:SRPBCC family protein [Roseateles cellulosilyticus]|uniref:SRPBCC family protein n=1 Tax=Pelomonas cellulosilytica TaxID=2906762 RepID=A0ABS8Y0B1_9BURK|nr:SRPBCC family protein [Pelomonas sp. P8]MCE4556439.1 SRPBCC family protein [Pelomonas sp. P8]
MSPLLFALALFIVALLVYLGRYSARVRAEATRFIAAPPDAVQARIADLSQWQAWNPWLEHARDALPTVEGHTLAWDVPHVGRARVTAVQPLRQQIAFALPFKYRGRSDWRLVPERDGTRVTWAFKGRVAFTLRAFATTVQGATALDLRFGLDRLAATLEGGPTAYELNYTGVQELPARHIAQQPFRGPLDGLATELPPRIAALRQQLTAAGLPADGHAVVHYLKTHLKLRTVEGRLGIELPAGAELPDGMTLHEQPAHAALVLRYDGPPESLELAWYQAMQRLRVEQLQPDPQRPPSARHVGDPVAGQRCTVQLQLPVKR